jgi:type IV secretory pathway protease TraF
MSLILGEGQLPKELAIRVPVSARKCILLAIVFVVISGLGLTDAAVAEVTLKVRDRIPVVMTISERIPVASLRIGDVILARVRRPVSIDDLVVVESGAPAILKVEAVRKRGILGQPAKVTLVASHVEIQNQQQVRLSGEWTLEGEDLMIEAVSGGAAICCLGFFLPGGEVVLPKGGGFSAFVDGDQEVTIQVGDVDNEGH